MLYNTKYVRRFWGFNHVLVHFFAFDEHWCRVQYKTISCLFAASLVHEIQQVWENGPLRSLYDLLVYGIGPHIIRTLTKAGPANDAYLVSFFLFLPSNTDPYQCIVLYSHTYIIADKTNIFKLNREHDMLLQCFWYFLLHRILVVVLNYALKTFNT